MNPIPRLFLDHPRLVGESYTQHLVTAGRFGAQMVGGGLACLVHAVVPALFVNSASSRVKKLYLQMRARQPQFSDRPPEFEQAAWSPEYEI
ncbi:MAG TPA: DUF6356 family protein [Sphingomicrobium sp.]